MTNKKTSKNVIDYDPLAWLNEEADDTAQPDNNTPPATAADEIEETAYGFFDNDQTPEQTSDIHSTDESSAFGFFDEEDQTGTATAPSDATEDSPQADAPTDEGSAYGFFDDADVLTTQAARLDSDSHVINLGAELTIRSVGACKELVEQMLSNGFDIRIAAGELQKIDSAGLQLIYSLKTTLEKTAQSIHWQSTSNIINDAARLIGMPRLCDDDGSDPGYGFFDDDQATSSTADSAGDDGYGFF